MCVLGFNPSFSDAWNCHFRYYFPALVDDLLSLYGACTLFLFGWLFQGKNKWSMYCVCVWVFTSLIVWGEFEVFTGCPHDLDLLTSVVSCLAVVRVSLSYVVPPVIFYLTPQYFFLLYLFSSQLATMPLFNHLFHSCHFFILTNSLFRFLTKREQQLMQRRHHAEELLQWKQQLDKEEAEVRRMEKEALAVWNRHTPQDKDMEDGQKIEISDSLSPSYHQSAKPKTDSEQGKATWL